MIPSIDAVLDFGESIGLPRIDLNARYNTWYCAIHEIAHWAIYPQMVVDAFLDGRGDKLRPGDIPSCSYLNEYLWYTGYFPGEWAARAYGLELIKINGWHTPTPSDLELGHNYRIWCETTDHQGNCGYAQLRNWGIDPSRGIFRPTKYPPNPALPTHPNSYLWDVMRLGQDVYMTDEWA